MLGFSMARGQHQFPGSPALLSVPGEITDPQLLQLQTTENGSRDKSSCSKLGQTDGHTKVRGMVLV